MKQQLFYTSKDVQRILQLGSLRTAQMRIKMLNDELGAEGLRVERGKIPIKYFEKRYGL